MNEDLPRPFGGGRHLYTSLKRQALQNCELTYILYAAITSSFSGVPR